MKLVIDLQGAQTSGSRFRGIGRYSVSFAQALVRTAGPHDVWIALNGLFPETIEPVRAAFDGLLPQDRIVVWQALGSVAASNPANTWKRQSAVFLREAFLAGLAPDIVHASSLFEGFVDDAVTGIGEFETTPTAVTLYDLIPLIYRDLYLNHPPVAAWYEHKLELLRRARLWLAISEASRRDGVERLGLPDEWVVNVSTAAEDMFKPLTISAACEQAIRQRYGLTKPFAMYTGGIDQRKNIEGLILAYAKLPKAVRAGHQLAIVCATATAQLETLRTLAAKRGLLPDEIVFTGFVPDEDMVALYNLCAGFVFPSWYEGFGLPALEAMKCGAAVIAAGCSSLPEVIGRVDALFDPTDENDMADRLHCLLTDEGFRADLRRTGMARADTYTWEASARRAWDAYERLDENNKRPAAGPMLAKPPRRARDPRPRLAYVTPLPIAGYNAVLLPELATYYAIDVVTDEPLADRSWIAANGTLRSLAWFDQNADGFDRILYHFGNSELHRPLFGLLERHPGTVVLHDFFLSGALNSSPGAFLDALYTSHGYRAVKDRYAVSDPSEILSRYPANLPVLQQANGVIVHSSSCLGLAKTWYGSEIAADWATIPLPIAPAAEGETAPPLRLSYTQGLVGRLYHDAIERFAARGPQTRTSRLIAAIATLDRVPVDPQEWLGMANAIAVNNKPARAPALLIDVSAAIEGKSAIPIDAEVLIRTDAVGGGYRIEPVYLDHKGIFRYARRYTLETVLDCPPGGLDDDPVCIAAGDIYLCLDQPLVAPTAPSAALAELRRQGVAIFHVLSALGYDNPAWRGYIGHWADGAICRSRAAADDLVRWLAANLPDRQRRFHVGYIAPDTAGSGVARFVDVILHDGWLCKLYDGDAADTEFVDTDQRA